MFNFIKLLKILILFKMKNKKYIQNYKNNSISINISNIIKNCKNNLAYFIVYFLVMIYCFINNSQQLISQVVDLQTNNSLMKYGDSKLLFDKGLSHFSELEVISALKNYEHNSSEDKLKYLQHNIDINRLNYKLAEAKIDKFITERYNSPYLPFVFYQKALVNFEQNKMDKAEIAFKETQVNADKYLTEREDPIYKDLAHIATYWRGVALAYYGKNIESEKSLTECYTNYPEGKFSDDAIFAMAQVSEFKGDYETAISSYNKIRTLYPKSNVYISSLIREANNYLLLRNFNSALLNLERAENVLNSIDFKDSIGVLYETQTYNDNHRENITYLRAEANNQAGNFQKSLTYYKAFNETFFNSPLINHVRLGTAWASLNLGQYNDALKNYDNVITKSDDKDWNAKSIAQLYRCITLRKLGNNEQAVKELVALSLQQSYPLLSQALLELGQYYYEQKDFTNAKKTLERADKESNEPVNTTRIYLLLGATYLELGMHEKAIQTYSKAEQLARNSSESNMPQRKWYLTEIALKQGIALIQNQKSSEAIPFLNQFLSEAGDDKRKEEALFWLAEAYYKLSMLNNSIQIYSKLLADFPNTYRREETLYGLGWSYFRMKNFKESSKVFDNLVDEFPKSKFAVEIFTRQGDGYYLTKNFTKAAESYTKAVKLGPNTEEGQYSAYQLCHALYLSNKYEQAITSLLNFISQYRKSPLAPNATYLIGWIRFLQRRYAEAIDNFTFLIESYSQSIHIPRTYYAIADCYYNLQKFESAMTSYKKVVESYPSHPLAPEAMRATQQCLVLLGREDEAIEIINNYTSQNQDSPFYRDFKDEAIKILFENRKYPDAISEYEKLIEKFPNNPKNAESYYWMGKSYASMNSYDEAVKTFSIVTNKYRDNEIAPVSLFEIGMVRKKQGMVVEADSVFNSVYKNYPKSSLAPQSLFEKAILYYQNNDTTKSMETYKFVADSFPNSEFGTESKYRYAKFLRLENKIPESIEQFTYLTNNLLNKELAAEAQYRIGELYNKNGDLDSAIVAFELVRTKFESYEDWFSLSLLNLGEIYEQKEIYSKAKEVYNVLAELRAEDDFGKTAKKRLSRIENKGDK